MSFSLKFACKTLLAKCSLLQVLLISGAVVLLMDLPLAQLALQILTLFLGRVLAGLKGRQLGMGR